VSIPGNQRCRLGLGLLLSAVVFACLNPRPDDQPLFSEPGAVPGNPSTGAPPTGVGMGDNLVEGTAGSGGSDPADTGSSPGADAGVPPDAGPQDDGDAGTRAD